MAPAAYKDLCLDAHDRMVLGRFWAAALGLELVDRGDEVAFLRGPTDRHTVGITEVPEPKTVKHRMHLDVYARSVGELVDLGASVVEEFPRWTVMADPEGGEFARWWAALLGGRFVDEGKDYVWVADVPGAPFETLDVAPVPEPKAAKNRVHLDVFGDVAAIVAHGATVVGEQPRWTVLTDPEGNEFCAFPRP